MFTSAFSAALCECCKYLFPLLLLLLSGIRHIHWLSKLMFTWLLTMVLIYIFLMVMSNISIVYNILLRYGFYYPHCTHLKYTIYFFIQVHPWLYSYLKLCWLLILQTERYVTYPSLCRHSSSLKKLNAHSLTLWISLLWTLSVDGWWYTESLWSVSTNTFSFTCRLEPHCFDMPNSPAHSSVMKTYFSCFHFFFALEYVPEPSVWWVDTYQ